MDPAVRALHLGAKPPVNRAYAGLRRRGYIVLRDAAQGSLYWVNGNRLTTYQLLALAVMRGVRLRSANNPRKR
jgi:hypothetical protein